MSFGQSWFWLNIEGKTIFIWNSEICWVTPMLSLYANYLLAPRQFVQNDDHLFIFGLLACTIIFACIVHITEPWAIREPYVPIYVHECSYVSTFWERVASIQLGQGKWQKGASRARRRGTADGNNEIRLAYVDFLFRVSAIVVWFLRSLLLLVFVKVRSQFSFDISVRFPSIWRAWHSSVDNRKPSPWIYLIIAEKYLIRFENGATIHSLYLFEWRKKKEPPVHNLYYRNSLWGTRFTVHTFDSRWMNSKTKKNLINFISWNKMYNARALRHPFN